MVQEGRLGTREILLEVPEDRLQVPDNRLEVGSGCLQVAMNCAEVRAGRLRSPANRPVARCKSVEARDAKPGVPPSVYERSAIQPIPAVCLLETPHNLL